MSRGVRTLPGARCRFCRPAMRSFCAGCFLRKPPREGGARCYRQAEGEVLPTCHVGGGGARVLGWTVPESTPPPPKPTPKAPRTQKNDDFQEKFVGWRTGTKEDLPPLDRALWAATHSVGTPSPSPGLLKSSMDVSRWNGTTGRMDFLTTFRYASACIGVCGADQVMGRGPPATLAPTTVSRELPCPLVRF